MTANTPVTYAFADKIATLTMDDGKANVMSESMLDALQRALDRAEADGADALVLSGRARIFSAGYDLATFQRPPADIVRVLRAGGELVLRMLSFPRPIVAACNGHAIAQGAFTLLAADVRLGCDGDFKLGLNEVAIGLTIPHYGVELARGRLSVPCFQHATVTGTLYAPREALAGGFLDRLVEPARLLELAREEASKLAKLDLNAHAGTKLRARKPTLDAMRAGIDSELRI